MISIDTELLKELVSSANMANAAIDQAVDALNRVATHYDWQCKEKNAINSYTESNKTFVKRLQEHSSLFFNALVSVSSEFENSENSISDMFSSLEAVIGSAIAISSGVINTGTWTPQLPKSTDTVISKIFKEIFCDNSTGNRTVYNSDGSYTVIDDSKPYVSQTRYSSDGNLLYTTMSSPLSNYEIKNFNSEISVCKFSDINLNVRGE